MSNTWSRTDPRNVNDWERVASGIGGAVLVAYGLARPSLLNTVLAIGGALMLERSLTGTSALYDALGINTRAGGETHPVKTYGSGKRGEHSIADEIERASHGSFPASDPPSWTPHSIGHPASAS